jgi:hypothetical protein
MIAVSNLSTSGVAIMKNLRIIAGSIALALAAGAMLIPVVSEAAMRNGGGGHGGGGHGGGFHGGGRGGGMHVGGGVRRGGGGGYGGGGYGGGGWGGGGWGGGYSAYCGPIQLTLGLCGGYGY